MLREIAKERIWFVAHPRAQVHLIYAVCLNKMRRFMSIAHLLVRVAFEIAPAVLDGAVIVVSVVVALISAMWCGREMLRGRGCNVLVAAVVLC